MSANIFPPILDSYLPAFLSNTQSYPIYFELSSMTGITSIKNILIKLVYQETNQSAIATSRYPDDIVYLKADNIGFDTESNSYFVSINNSMLDTGAWQPGIYYRVQLRFGLSDLYTTQEEFFLWKTEQIKQGMFSEWSTAMVLKPITQPRAEIINNQVFASGLIVDAVNTETSYMPTFFGRYSCSIYEPIDRYKFNLYDIDGELLETSGWLQYNVSDNTPILGEADMYSCAILYRFKTILNNVTGYTYSVDFLVTTRNLFEVLSEPYTFNIDVNPIPYNNPFVITTYDSKNETIRGRCDNEGVIDVRLTSNSRVAGNFVLLRTDERSNYRIWEDMTYLTYSGEQDSIDEIVYSDYTIESGINYRYAIQFENYAGLRSDMVLEYNNPVRQSNFLYSYLYNKDLQLKLKFNNTITSYKRTTLVSKQDTLGSKYPTVLRNGDADYHEFTLTGLISLHMDDYSSFFLFENEDGFFYKGELIIPPEKYREANSENAVFGKYIGPDGKSHNRTIDVAGVRNTFDHNLTDNNRYIERKFREKVEDFLYNSEPKLYKSATEGNMIIAITNVSMTPQNELNRLIYNFTATAYEIDECSLENLKKYDMVPYYTFQRTLDEGRSFGQIRGFFTGERSRDPENDDEDLYPIQTQAENLVSYMEEQVGNESASSDRFLKTIAAIEAIWIEPYPKINFDKFIIEQDALIADEKNKGDNADLAYIAEHEAERLKILDIQLEVEHSGRHPYYTVVINGQEVLLGENRPYVLDNLNMSSFTDIHLKYSGAIILNYVCITSTIENIEEVEYGQATVSIWNQIAGMFTDSEDVLINYNYDANTGISTMPSELDTIPQYEVHDFEDHNIGVYNTLNIMNVIKEKAIQEIQTSQNIVFTSLGEDDLGNPQWTDGQYYYTFGRVTALSIEGEAGTPIRFKTYSRESASVDAPYIEFTAHIGPTNKLVYRNLDNYLFLDILLEDPLYVIVDFRADTTLTVKGLQKQQGGNTNASDSTTFTRQRILI